MSAKRDILDIYNYIARRSQSQVPAREFVAALRLRCKDIATLTGIMGRPRPELGFGLRSRAYGNYLILFRYSGETLQIVRILEAHRDIGAEDMNEGD